jgi:hypothetical protein
MDRAATQMCTGTTSHILFNPGDDLSPRDPRQQALHWLNDEQLGAMRSLVALAYQRYRAGGRR